MYITHAENIVAGKPYADSGYIQNPVHYVAPKSYPPGFPLLLAPIFALFGSNLFAFQVLMITCLVGFLGVAANLFREYLREDHVILLIIIIGLHPYLWEFKHNVLSDIPFVLFAFAALWSYQRMQRAEPPKLEFFLWAGLCVLCGYYAFLTRTIGVVLLPTFLLHYVIRNRHRTRVLLAVAAVCLTAFAVHQLFSISGFSAADESLSNQDGYGPLLSGLVAYDLDRLIRSVRYNTAAYARHAMFLWDNGHVDIVKKLLFVVSTIPFAIGFIRRLRDFSVLEVFALCYTAALLPWGFGWPRYAIPLFVLYGFYLAVGIVWLNDKLRSRSMTLAAAGILGALAMSYGARYVTMNYGPMRTEVNTPAAEEFYKVVQRETNEDDVFIGPFTRQLVYLMRRPVSVLHPSWRTSGSGFSYASEIDAEYVIVSVSNRGYIGEWVAAYPDRFELTYANEAFRLYRIRYEAQ